MIKLRVDQNIAVAKTLSTDFYTNPEYFEQSKEKIFSRSWQYVHHTSDISEPGTVLPFTLLEDFLNEPLLLSRDTHNQLFCLSNVCTHRGAILLDKPCSLTDIRCPYHGRRFHLDGKFLSMPEFKEVENFPASADDLANLPLHTIGPMVFTSLEKQHSADPYFREMVSRIDWMPINELTFHPELSKDYMVDAHWALYCENYLEGFHIPFVHPTLNQVIDFGKYTTELFPYSNLQVGVAKEGELVFDIPPSSPDYGKNIGGYYFWVFPNMMFNFYPWGLSLNIVKPVAIEKTKVSFLTFIWDESKYNKGAGSGLDGVEMEDEHIVESVQKGIRSRFYSHGRYSVKHEKGTHHFHRLVAESMQ